MNHVNANHFPDAYAAIRDAYKGKASHGYVAEIYAYTLVDRAFSDGSRDFTSQEAAAAASNLLELCRAFRDENPDAVFSLEKHTARLFEEIDIFTHTMGADPIPPFSHRIHLKVHPRELENPKICLALALRFTGSRKDEPPARYRIIVESYGSPDFFVEAPKENRLGEEYWAELKFEPNERFCRELAARAMISLCSTVDARKVRDGVVYIDLGTQDWYDEV